MKKFAAGILVLVLAAFGISPLLVMLGHRTRILLTLIERTTLTSTKPLSILLMIPVIVGLASPSAA